MARILGRQIGDRRDNFSRQSFFLLAMATKTVAAWSAEPRQQLIVEGKNLGKGACSSTWCTILADLVHGCVASTAWSGPEIHLLSC